MEAGEVIGFIYDNNPDAQLTPPQITSENPDVTVTNPTISPVLGSTTSYTYEVTAGIQGDDSESGGAERDGGALQIKVTDSNDGNVAVGNTQVYLYDPVLIDPGVAVQAVAGSPFQGNVATFSTTDLSAGASEFTAVINWGDGQSSPGTIVSTGVGQFRVVGDHTYAQPGSFTVSSTISDDEGQSVSDTSTAAVSAPPIVGQRLTIAGGHRKSFSGNVATFASPVAVPAGNFTALINWGDGTSSSGVVTSDGTSSGSTAFTVSGSHHFSRRKSSPVRVTILENGGGQTVIPFRTGVGVSRRGAGSPQQRHGARSLAATNGLVLETSHPAGPRALLQARGHLKLGSSGAALPASRTAELLGRIQ